MIFIRRNSCRNAARGVPATHDEDGQLGVASVGAVPRIAHAEQQQG
jgi:hypothetical protein